MQSNDVSKEALDRLVAREVPVEWYGVASDVRLMGDFDGWTRGTHLSAEVWGSDNVFTRFTAKMLLPKVRNALVAVTCACSFVPSGLNH